MPSVATLSVSRGSDCRSLLKMTCPWRRRSKLPSTRNESVVRGSSIRLPLATHFLMKTLPRVAGQTVLECGHVGGHPAATTADAEVLRAQAPVLHRCLPPGLQEPLGIARHEGGKLRCNLFDNVTVALICVRLRGAGQCPAGAPARRGYLAPRGTNCP